MIYRLQRKFIMISAISLLAVVALAFALIIFFNVSSMNVTLDSLAQSISAGGGRFPDSFDDFPQLSPDEHGRLPGYSSIITPETRFATRHFTVWFNADGELMNTNTESIYAISEQTAVEYARSALQDNDGRGWIENYRYTVFNADADAFVVFIDATVNRAALIQSVTIAAFVLLGCATLVLLLIILLSKRVVKPIALSHEKQRQFVTDANHELKTPLTLILANLDIAEAELGRNEWLDDIRSEGERMSELVNQLVALSRMDEEGQQIERRDIPVSEVVADTVCDFQALATQRGKRLFADIDADIHLTADETLIRRLLSILFDNALKYCDDGGEIFVTLKRRRNIILTVENTYTEIDSLELERLFDRFYRADAARTFSGGYGIGLSMAKAIADKHRAEICAYKKDASHIGFRLTFKP